MSHQPVIDGLDFARAGGRLQGAWPVTEFQRLRDALLSDAGSLRYELRGVPDEQGHPALRLKVEGTLQLACQRCLAPLAWPLRIESTLRLAVTQAEVDAEPLEAEGPESIVAGKEMQVRMLVEDEVLLALPLAPRHESCTGAARGAQADVRQGPFAGLRGLIGGAKH
jgi:uncharacterized protein